MFEGEKDEKIVATAGRSGEENSAPVEMMRRLKESTEKLNNSIEKLDKNTVRYSRILIDLTILLFITAFIQTIISLRVVSRTDWDWAFLVGLFVYAIYFITRRLEKERKKIKTKK